MQSSLSSTCVIIPDSHTHTYIHSDTHIYPHTHIFICMYFPAHMHKSCHAGWYMCELMSAFISDFTRFTHLSRQLSYIISDDSYIYRDIEIYKIYIYRDIYKIYMPSLISALMYHFRRFIYIYREREIHMTYAHAISGMCRPNRPLAHSTPHASRHTIHTSLRTCAHHIASHFSSHISLIWSGYGY